MAFVVSQGSLKTLDKPYLPPAYSLNLASDYTADYAEIWRTQPAVRTVVSFLARNIAQLGLHVFERVSDDERRRLTDHPLAALIRKPNPRTTRFRLLNALVHDLGIYDVGYWVKLDGPGLLRLPPAQTAPVGDNWMWPDAFEFRGQRGKKIFGADEVVYFRGYHPTAYGGAPPIEALRRTLAEEYEAGRMRQQTLANGARMSGYIERPVGAPTWGRDQRERFRRQWRAQYAGGGPQAGGTPVLEDGMQFHAVSQTAEQLQYVEARKLTREEVAAAYFIPPPMVGILEHATFSNITEQHKMLYQDTLGPWLSMIAEDIALQLIPDIDSSANVYVEFNLKEKLRGSFTEEAQALQATVGAPHMTRNEARARQNLPPVVGGDELIVPLNVIEGGQASPSDSGSQNVGGEAASPRPRVKERAPETLEQRVAGLLKRFFERQADSVKSALGAKQQDVEWWDSERWDRELSDDLMRSGLLVSEQVAADTLAKMGFDPSVYDTDRTLAFMRAVADRVAGQVNATTLSQLEQALVEDDWRQAVDDVFTEAQTSRVEQSATTVVTTFSGFATQEAAKQASGDRAMKTWQVNSQNPRASHAAMAGETVPVEARFSNGMLWPGESWGDPDEVANCRCSLIIDVPD